MANLFHLMAYTSATISLILLFISPLSTANTAVLDTDGNPLQPGSRYYILTAGRGVGRPGGITAQAFRADIMCPEFLFQFKRFFRKGNPVFIAPSKSSEKEIKTDMDVNIFFGPIGNPICQNFLGVWKVDSSGGVPMMISTNGTLGDPNSSVEAFLSSFEIRQVSGSKSYKIVYCFARTNVNPGPPECQQVDPSIPAWPQPGSYLKLEPIDENLSFVGFVFKKVDDGSSTSTY